MTMRRLLASCALLSLPVTLGGCVAAVAAIPVLAGGTMASGVGEEGDSAPPIDEGATLPPPPFERETVAPTEETTETVAVVPPAEDEPAPGLGEPIENVAMDGAAGDEPLVTDEAELAAPTIRQAAGDSPGASAPPALAAPASAAPAPSALNPYSAFFNHAIAQAGLDPVDDPRRSAILATPGSLEPVTGDCAIRAPAVLIDLDPAGETLELDQPVSPNPELAELLAALRLRNVAVFWISGASAAGAGKLRERLLVSGLDPWGRDGLLLMRRAEDRKQIRRRELSEMHCVVAIAGDAKGDFDELFDYLKEPAAAAPLDALIGDGWFLTPAPFDPQED